MVILEVTIKNEGMHMVSNNIEISCSVQVMTDYY